MLVASLIIDCSKMISFFRLIDVEFSINFCIEIIFDSYIDFKYFLNLFQSVLSTLYASFIELSTVSIFLQIIENLIISWSDSVATFSLIDQFVILLTIWRVAKVKSIINVDVWLWSFFMMHCFEKVISSEIFINSHWFLVSQSIKKFVWIKKKFWNFIMHDMRWNRHKWLNLMIIRFLLMIGQLCIRLTLMITDFFRYICYKSYSPQYQCLWYAKLEYLNHL